MKEKSNLQYGFPITFTVDKKMLDALPQGRIKSPFCRKGIEIFIKLLSLPKEIQNNILKLMGYNDINIYERQYLVEKEESTNQIVNSDELNKLIEKQKEYIEVIKIFYDMFLSFNKSLRESKSIDIPKFKELKPTEEKMNKISKIMSEVK